MARHRRGGYQPPATLDNIRTWLDGEMLFYPVPFNVLVCCVGLRVDVGIDPYIETVSAFHSSYRVVA